MLDPTWLSVWLDQITDSVTAMNAGRRPPTVTPATYLMAWYLDPLARVGAFAFALARRVPSLAPAGLALHISSSAWPDEVALLDRRFACLPDDPEVNHPDAEVVADERELARILRTRLVDHARAFHDSYLPGVKISSRQRWGTFTDVLDVALWQTGAARGKEVLGVEESALVLDKVYPPLTSATSMYQLIDRRGRCQWTRRRSSCCFYFRVPDSELCFTCPRVTDADRVERASSEV